MAPALCRDRLAARPERRVAVDVLSRQRAALLRALRSLGGEGFSQVMVLRGPEEADALVIER
jgi:predicted kinase